MFSKVPFEELQTRMIRFRSKMDATEPEWNMAVIFGKINLYYFTGTLQEGMLFVPRDNEAVFWVRRSYERATNESLFPIIRQMESFRDVAGYYKTLPDTIFLETELIPLAFYQRFKKYFPLRISNRQIIR